MATDIKTVKEKHQAALMALPGVVSVGIGMAQGKKLIIIGIDGKHPDTEQDLPKELEGYKVVTELVGSIKAR